ncbi:hypothetical protein J437_LFUL017258, partial [Ladona fulva]
EEEADFGYILFYWIKQQQFFYTIYPCIKEDEAKFLNFCRKSPASFDELLGILRNSLTHIWQPVAALLICTIPLLWDDLLLEEL